LRFRLCFLGALLVSGVHDTDLAAQGRAQTADTFSLEYAAPAICPERSQFVAAITDRAPDAREIASGSVSFRFVVQLEAFGSLARGTLSVEQQDGSRSRREVAEAPCAEVVESMAVILSLILAGSESAPVENEPPTPSDAPAAVPVAPAIAPAAGAATPPGEPPAAPVPPAAPTPPPPGPSVPPAEPARTPPAAAVAPREPEASSEDVDSDDSERWRFGFPLSALAETGVAPSVAFGGQGGLDLWWTLRGVWSPSARLTARYLRSGLETSEFGSARFRLAALRVELCPVRWPARSRIFGRVCALFDGGQLEANPEDAAQGQVQSQTMPWFGGGGSLRLESMLANALSLEAAADLTVLGRSDRFTFEPGSQTAHEVPTISAMFSVGLVLRLP